MISDFGAKWTVGHALSYGFTGLLAQLGKRAGCRAGGSVGRLGDMPQLASPHLEWPTSHPREAPGSSLTERHRPAAPRRAQEAWLRPCWLASPRVLFVGGPPTWPVARVVARCRPRCRAALDGGRPRWCSAWTRPAGQTAKHRRPARRPRMQQGPTPTTQPAAPPIPSVWTQEQPTLFVIDALGLIYRSYHALAHVTMSSPMMFDTRAIYGFTLVLLSLVADYAHTNPIVVVFEGQKVDKEPDFRTAKYPQYKAQCTGGRQGGRALGKTHRARPRSRRP
jgi:hypothetical protein